jgi:ATPases with chaperone activity, ATP-binding subunit
MLSRDLEVTLNSAFKRAREARHEYMTVEHLLLGLLDNASAVQVLNACGANLSALRDELDQFVGQTTPSLPDDSERDTQPTLGFQRVLQRAVFHVQSSGKQEVTGGKRAGGNFFRARVSGRILPKAAGNCAD